jgi:hypothetical protein
MCMQVSRAWRCHFELIQHSNNTKQASAATASVNVDNNTSATNNTDSNNSSNENSKKRQSKVAAVAERGQEEK